MYPWIRLAAEDVKEYTAKRIQDLNFLERNRLKQS